MTDERNRDDGHTKEDQTEYASCPPPVGEGSLLEDPYFITLAVFMGLYFSIALSIVANISFVGYNDAAAYGDMAINFLKGRGLTITFVDNYHAAKPFPIPHHTDHWFSLYSLAVALAMCVFGENALAVKLPSLLAFALTPLLLYILGRRWVSRHGAFAGAFLVALNPVFVKLSLTGYPDHFYICLALIALLFTDMARHRPWMWVGAGIAAALMVLVKAHGVLLLVAGGLMSLWNRSLRKVFRENFFIAGAGLFVLIVLAVNLLMSRGSGPGGLSYYPRLMVTLGQGANAYQDHYQRYEGKIPSLVEYARQKGARGLVSRFFSTAAQFWRGNYYFSYQPGVPHIMGHWLLMLMVVVGMVLHFREKSLQWVLTYLAVLFLFLSTFFAYQYRYLLLGVALSMLYAWRGVSLFTNDLLAYLEVSLNPKTQHKVATIVLLVVYAGGVSSSFFATMLFKSHGVFPLQDDQFMVRCLEMTAYNTEPGATIISVLPAAVAFHTRRASVMVPYGDMQDMFTAIEEYHVGYYLDVVGKAHHFLKSYPQFRLIKSIGTPWQRADLYGIDVQVPPYVTGYRNVPNNFMFPSSYARGSDEIG